MKNTVISGVALMVIVSCNFKSGTTLSDHAFDDIRNASLRMIVNLHDDLKMCLSDSMNTNQKILTDIVTVR